MKAAVRTRYGPPEVVPIAEVAKPAPKDNEVLVRVHATTVNRTDCGLRAAKPFVYRFLLGLFTRDEQTYDLVMDAVGKSSFGRCRRLLKPHGIDLSSDLGPKAQNPVLALVTPRLGGRRVLFPLPLRPDQEIARYLRGLLESGAFRPVIDRRYRLDQIVAAYRYLETGRKIGNVVITVEP